MYVGIVYTLQAGRLCTKKNLANVYNEVGVTGYILHVSRLKTAVKMIQNLLDSLINGELQYLRNIVLIAGLFYLITRSFKIVLTIYNGFKTFFCPLIWPRDFQKEYGPWAGNLVFTYESKVLFFHIFLSLIPTKPSKNVSYQKSQTFPIPR